jgi:hypothetical protein
MALPNNNPMTIAQLSAAQLQEATHLKQQIERLEAKLYSLLDLSQNGTPTQASSKASKAEKKPKRRARRKRTVTSAQPAEATTAKPVKRKRKMSTEGRARIAAAARKRWAKVKATSKTEA